MNDQQILPPGMMGNWESAFAFSDNSQLLPQFYFVFSACSSLCFAVLKADHPICGQLSRKFWAGGTILPDLVLVQVTCFPPYIPMTVFLKSTEYLPTSLVTDQNTWVALRWLTSYTELIIPSETTGNKHLMGKKIRLVTIIFLIIKNCFQL